MAVFPVHLAYELSRRQRLVAHRRVWTPGSGGVVVLVVAAVYATFGVRWWLFPAIPGAFWLTRGFWMGLANIALVPRHVMDIELHEEALGFMARGERWWCFLDGVLWFEPPAPGL